MSTPRPGSSLDGVHALLREGTVAGLSDRDLLDRFERGAGDASGRAFAALVDRHGPMVLRTCRAVLPDPADAQDAFQVTFLVLARKAGSIRDRGSVAAWLHGVAYRTAAYARGASARRRRHERVAAGRTREAVEPSRPDEAAAAVVEEVGRLPERLRGAVVLCEFEGLSVDEAARRLGCPAGTVKSRLSRARDRLKRRLTRRGHAPTLALPPASPVPASLAGATVAAVVSRTGPITAALAAWESEVLRAMWWTKLKTGILVCAFGLAAGGTALVAAGQAQQEAAPPTKKDGDTAKVEPTTDEMLEMLARSRVEALKRNRDATYRLYAGGEANMVAYLQAQREYNNAFLNFLDKPEDRIRALRTMLKGTERLLDTVRELYRKDQTTLADVNRAEAERIDAAIRLLEEESGRKARLGNSPRPELLDAGTVDDVLKRFYWRVADAALQDLLKREVALDLPEGGTLEDALKQIKAAGQDDMDPGLSIHVDPVGLQQAAMTMGRKVGPFKVKGPASHVLTVFLDSIGLKYEARDGVVTITAK